MEHTYKKIPQPINWWISSLSRQIISFFCIKNKTLTHNSGRYRYIFKEKNYSHSFNNIQPQNLCGDFSILFFPNISLTFPSIFSISTSRPSSPAFLFLPLCKTTMNRISSISGLTPNRFLQQVWSNKLREFPHFLFLDSLLHLPSTTSPK